MARHALGQKRRRRSKSRCQKRRQELKSRKKKISKQKKGAAASPVPYVPARGKKRLQTNFAQRDDIKQQDADATMQEKVNHLGGIELHSEPASQTTLAKGLGRRGKPRHRRQTSDRSLTTNRTERTQNCTDTVREKDKGGKNYPLSASPPEEKWAAVIRDGYPKSRPTSGTRLEKEGGGSREGGNAVKLTKDRS